MDYRFKHTVPVIYFPEGDEEEDRGFEECCCVFQVLASTTDPDPAINDVRGVYTKKADISDVVSFEMTKVGTGVIANYGDVGVFPNEPLGVGFIYDWRQVLDNEGPGRYQISISYTIAGVTGSAFKGCYDLQAFTQDRAEGTVRLLSYFNSYFLLDAFDFTGSNFNDSIRFPGFFGTRKPGTVLNQLIDVGRKDSKATRENLNEYAVVTDPIQSCISKRILDFFFLNEDRTYISDHNNHNHVYYTELPVVPAGTPEPDYPKMSRLASFTLPYGDKDKLSKSMYNGL